MPVKFRIAISSCPNSCVVDSVDVAFEPSLLLDGNPATIALRNPVMRVLGDGIEQMRFAASAEDLAAAAWIDPADPYDGYELSAVAEPQWIFGEFSSDFGFTAIDSVEAVPDSLSAPTFMISGGDEATSSYTLEIVSDATASRMRFAETVEQLAVSSWEDYAAATSLDHGACAGDRTKIVYGQFANDWFTSAVVSDTILWIPPQPLQVDIEPPADVVGGADVTVAGTAIAGTCDAGLDLVEVDFGDGWTAASGLESWSAVWAVPAVTETQDIVIRARVTAGAVTAQDSLTVSVSP